MKLIPNPKDFRFGGKLKKTLKKMNEARKVVLEWIRDLSFFIALIIPYLAIYFLSKGLDVNKSIGYAITWSFVIVAIFIVILFLICLYSTFKELK